MRGNAVRTILQPTPNTLSFVALIRPHGQLYAFYKA